VEQELGAVHAAGIKSGRTGPVEPHSRSAVSLAAYRERAQLRFTTDGAPVSKEDTLGEAARAGAAALSRLVNDVLMVLHEEEGVPTERLELLDAFWYPGKRRWETLEATDPLPAPCPAHEDPGLLTAIYDDVSALQARRADGSWVHVELRANECALVAGRALAALTRGRIPACTHRVGETALSRTSLVYEALPEERGLQERAAAEAAAAAKTSDAAITQKYARAANALMATGERHAAEGSCVLM